jgi:flagellar biosynthesis/type III secretory pathway M-ring protein FliF/YscJ
MDQKYIPYIPYIVGGVLLAILTVLIMSYTKRKNEDNKLKLESDTKAVIKVDVNNLVAIRNSNMAQVALKKMLSGKQPYNPYGIDDVDKLY